MNVRALVIPTEPPCAWSPRLSWKQVKLRII